MFNATALAATPIIAGSRVDPSVSAVPCCFRPALRQTMGEELSSSRSAPSGDCEGQLVTSGSGASPPVEDSRSTPSLSAAWCVSGRPNVPLHYHSVTRVRRGEQGGTAPPAAAHPPPVYSRIVTATGPPLVFHRPHPDPPLTRHRLNHH